MERKLKSLFEFQKFEANPALQSVIDSVHSRYMKRELGPDDMEWVNAAGTPNARPVKKDNPRSNGSC